MNPIAAAAAAAAAHENDLTVNTAFVETDNWGKMFLRIDYFVRHADFRRTFNQHFRKTDDLTNVFTKLRAFFRSCLISCQQKLQHSNKLRRQFSSSSSSSSFSVQQASSSFSSFSLPNYDNFSIDIVDSISKKKIQTDVKCAEAFSEQNCLVVADYEFAIKVNLPQIKCVHLPDVLLIGMHVTTRLEFDVNSCRKQQIKQYSRFQWFRSVKDYEQIGLSDQFKQRVDYNLKKNIKYSPYHQSTSDRRGQDNNRYYYSNYQARELAVLSRAEWLLLEEGVNKRVIQLSKSTLNKLIKVVVVPHDGVRSGNPIQCISNSKVESELNYERFPMTARHKLTNEALGGKSNDKLLRVVSYNILARLYSDQENTRRELYPYCSSQYIEYSYRRILLLHELKHYNADIIFLQECDREFAQEELKLCMLDYGVEYKAKATVEEGEAVLFRSDRFRFIKSFDIKLVEELKRNSRYKEIWSKIERLTPSFHKTIKNKGTILQLVQVESLDYPGHHMLLANTHLYFSPEASFMRLLQSIVATNHINSIKNNLAADSSIKQVDVLFAGDFNSTPDSIPFDYLLNGRIGLEDLADEHQKTIRDHLDQMRNPFDFSTEICAPFTQYQGAVHNICDYIFYEKRSFRVHRQIPMPSERKLAEYVALPSKAFPSDHIAIIIELEKIT